MGEISPEEEIGKEVEALLSECPRCSLSLFVPSIHSTPADQSQAQRNCNGKHFENFPKKTIKFSSGLICILSQDSCVVGNPECKCPFKRHFRGIKISVFACSFTRDKRRSICECVCPQDFQLTQIWFGVNSEALARWFTWWLTAARCCQSINYHKGLNRER